ncbi:MAG: hypothetical protein HQ593_06035 [Candidatus Omnitrophica bacterium]|nr:hypothetical protein [Candidatus Omnitrophota bacterium]
MDDQKNISPEEKLLNLIRRKQPHQESSAAHPAVEADLAEDEATAGKETKKADKRAFNFLFRGRMPRFRKMGAPDIKNVKTWNSIFTAFFILAALSLIYNIAMGFFIEEKVESFIAGKTADRITRAPVVDTTLFEEKPKSYYLEEMQGRDLFRAPFFQDGEGSRIDDLQEKIKSFSLLGVVAGEDPQAIIEDKEAAKTYFLKKGESFNGVRVLEIFEGKAILDINGEEIEIVL